MASLLAIILVVEIVVAVFTTAGAACINDVFWRLYISTPLGRLSSRKVRERRELQQSYLQVRRDLNATSSQDEFAKWAKLRRQHDKMLEDLDKMKADLDSTKALFDKTATTARWLCTSGIRWFIPFWYSRLPIFWLPHGWFPYYAEWLISFPRAPIGSVSVASWQLACTGLVALLSDLTKALVRLLVVVHARREAKGPRTEEAMREAPPIATATSTAQGGDKEAEQGS